MGIFSTNSRVGFGNYTVEAAQGYDGAGAGYRILAECYQNDMALFNGMIEQDFAEAYGYVNESTLIQEGAIANFFNKIKQMFLKLIEKIKGLINSFMTKFMATFIRDNKSLVNKYKKQVASNLRDGRLKDMTFKMHETSHGDKEGKPKTGDNAKAVAREVAQKVNKIISDNKGTDKAPDEIQKYIDNTINSDKFFKDMSGYYEDNFEKDFKQDVLGDMTEYNEYTSGLNDKIQESLVNGSKTIRELNDTKTTTEKLCREAIREIEAFGREVDSLEKDATKTYVGNTITTTAMNKSTASKLQSAIYQATLMDQKIQTSACTWRIDCVKTMLKEQRSVYIKAASARAVKKENAVLFDAIDEAVSYDVDTMFEGRVDSFEDLSAYEM